MRIKKKKTKNKETLKEVVINETEPLKINIIKEENEEKQEEVKKIEDDEEIYGTLEG